LLLSFTPAREILIPVQDEAPDLSPKLNAALAGRYEVVRELGRGGMATVYLATDVKHGRDVAIKVLHPELAATIGGDRFEREIRLAAKLQHPHILGMFDSGVADGLLYYVMPFVKGESLRDRIDREGMLPVEDALQITLEVNDALGHAHAQGIIHRDIKPENILLSGGHALVADFGIARAISDGGSAKKLTQTGMSMGTAYYMAPEQSAGEVVGPSADLYSLGCVLYEMLAGEPPFTGKNAMQIMARHAMENVPSVRIMRNVVPEDIENAIFVAMNKAPADRPQNAEQFAQLLGIISGNTASMRMLTPTMQRRVPSGAQTAIQAMQARPWWKRPGAAIGGVAAIAVLGIAIWKFAGGGGGGAALGPDARRVAVLYFSDASRDSSLRALADGLTEGLIRSLASAKSLTVISATGVEKFRNAAVGPDSVARALRVGYLVRGEVEPEGTQVRVSLQLVDASGATVSRQSFSRPSTDILAMGDTLAVLTSDLVRQQLRQEIEVRQQRATTSSGAAWLLVQRGSQARRRAEVMSSSGDSLAFDAAYHEADSLFAAASKEDPRWPEPEVMRASFAYRRGYLLRGDAVQVRRWTAAAQEHANRALEVDPDNADALEFRGRARYMAWLFAGEADANKAKALLADAKADLEKSTQLNPGQAGAWAELSHLYYQPGAGELTDVNIAAQRALEADEFLTNAETILQRLFLSSYDLGQFDKAQQQCGDAQRRFRASQIAVRCQLFLLTTRDKSPDVAAAWKLADSTVALAPAPRRQFFRLQSDLYVAAVIARAGKAQPALADSARRVAVRSEGDEKVDGTRDLALIGAFVYSILDDRDAAMRLLKLYVANNAQRRESLRDDPGWWFRDLAADPRYKQLVGSN
jgi:TolB-like protein